jgi:integral membrane sensor domain MASE1
MGIQADPQLPVPRYVADSSIRLTRIGDLTTFMVAVVVTALAGLAGDVLKTMSGEIAPIWFGNAMLLSQRMAASDRRGGWVIAGGALGNLAAYLIFGDTLKVSFSYSAANVLEVLMLLAFVPRCTNIYEFCRPKTFAVFVAGAMLTPLVSGVIAITMLRGQLELRDLPDFANWSISDALSLAILTPGALIFWTGEVANLWRADTRLRTGLLLAVVCAVTIALFAQSRIEILYWTLVPIVLLAFQADLAAVMLGLLLCLGIALSFTIRGSGPLGTLLHESMNSRILHLQLYFLAALSIALPVSAIQSQRNRLVDMLRDGERRYRLLAENATDVVMNMALDGRLTYVSPRSHALLGYAPDHLVDTHFAEIALP